MSRLYAALEDRLLVVRGEGPPGEQRGWTASESLVGAHIECVAASPDAPERVVVGTADAGLQRSTDGGETFQRVGTFGDRVTAVAISPHDPDVVWVGAEPSAVYYSADGADTWTQCGGLTDLSSAKRWSFPPRPKTHHVRGLAVNPHDRSHIYVAIEAGAFVRSVDGGETWQDHPDGARRDTHTIATHADDPCRVYVAAGDGYAESTDCGESWTYPQDGLEHRYVWGLAVDPGDPDRVVVSAARGARNAHSHVTADAYVYRREEGVWTVAMDGLPAPDGTVRAVLASGGEGEFYALTNHGLFYSGDGARSWTSLGVAWSEEYRSKIGHGLAVVG